MDNPNRELKLKACPFCSGRGYVYYNEVGKQFYAGCINELGTCKVITSTVGYDDAETAADAWNRRGTIILQ